jgi:hypothetical protein
MHQLTSISGGYAYVDNEDYKRMGSLSRLANGDYREDVLSNDLAPWVLEGVFFTADAHAVNFRP